MQVKVISKWIPCSEKHAILMLLGMLGMSKEFKDAAISGPVALALEQGLKKVRKSILDVCCPRTDCSAQTEMAMYNRSDPRAKRPCPDSKTKAMAFTAQGSFYLHDVVMGDDGKPVVATMTLGEALNTVPLENLIHCAEEVNSREEAIDLLDPTSARL